MFTKTPTSLSGAYIIEPQVFGDTRGFFMESYSAQAFADINIHTVFVQDNHSKSKKGVLRGMHFQSRKPQTKLVRVLSGSVYDVIIDLRVGSPTFGKWEGFILSSENKKMLYVPRGFAHGFLTLEDETEFLYKCDDVYDGKREGGVIWNDPTLSIDWENLMQEYGISTLEISEKDTKNKEFAKLGLQNPFIYSEYTDTKQFQKWIGIKTELHHTEPKPKKISEGQIWWVSFGENIGNEMNGKGVNFTRPIIVYKKLSATQFLCIPTSTKIKEGSWYIPFFQHKEQQVACLQQVRILDFKRFDNLVSMIDDADMRRIQAGFQCLYCPL